MIGTILLGLAILWVIIEVAKLHERVRLLEKEQKKSAPISNDRNFHIHATPEQLVAVGQILKSNQTWEGKHENTGSDTDIVGPGDRAGL